MQLVVSLYDENISWIFHVPYHWKIFIYHKSNTLNFMNSGFNLLNHNINIFQLPNIGDLHSYLTHISKNYNSLGDLTVFCSGDPFKKCPHFNEILQHKTLLSLVLNSVKLWPDNHSNSVSDINSGFVLLGPTFDMNQYAINKEAILKHSKDTYDQLLLNPSEKEFVKLFTPATKIF